MNATDALALSVRNEVYVLVDGTEKMIVTGCFQAEAGVRMACLKLDDGTWHNVPAGNDLHVTRVLS